MADANEQKEQTVRMDLPPQSESKPPVPDAKSRETVRIQLGLCQPADKSPLRTQTGPSRVSKPAAQVLTPEIFLSPSSPPQVSTEPSFAAQAPGPVATLPNPVSLSPKNETARIARMPDPPSKSVPTVQMKKTQPLIAMPHAAPTRTSIAVAPAEKNITPLSWVLLGVSASILIIQIWIYFS
jgi:hypothetical protein